MVTVPPIGQRTPMQKHTAAGGDAINRTRDLETVVKKDVGPDEAGPLWSQRPAVKQRLHHRQCPARVAFKHQQPCHARHRRVILLTPGRIEKAVVKRRGWVGFQSNVTILNRCIPS